MGTLNTKLEIVLKYLFTKSQVLLIQDPKSKVALPTT